LEYEQNVRKEAAEETVYDRLVCSEKLFPVSRRRAKISPDRVILGPDVDSILGLLDGPEWVALTKTLQKNE